MMVRKAVAGSVLAAGLGVAGMIGAGSASADPGAAVSISGIHVGIGDASASSTFGNAAAGFNGGSANASGGVGNVAIASGTNAVADIDGRGSFNTAAAVGDDSSAVISDNAETGTSSNGNVVFAGRGSSSVVDGNLNLVSNTCAGSTLSVSGTAQIQASPGNVACE